MKNKLIILLLFATTWQANAQKNAYINLLDTGKIWHTATLSEFDGIETTIITIDFENPYYANDTTYYKVEGGIPGIIIREDTILKNFNLCKKRYIFII